MSTPTHDWGGTRLRTVAMIMLTSLIASLFYASVAPPSGAATAVAGGPVILDGNDPADHVFNVTAYVKDVYTNLDANLAAGYSHNGQVAVVGSCKSVLDGMGTGETFVQFNSVLAVEGLFSNIGTNNYKIIHVCSNDDSTLASTVEAELDKWGSAIAAHVNRGGGLFATGHYFRWLSDLFPTLTVTYGGTSSSYVTSDGATFFPNLPVDTQVNAINHFTFSNVSSTPLLPLLTESTGGAGRLVAIGGTTVRFPQISFTGATTGQVGTSEAFTLQAADANGTPLSSNTFTWTITGPTAAAGTGTATTDANGNYTFNFAGTAKGQDRKSVV